MSEVHFEYPLQWLPQQPRTIKPKKPASFRDDAYYNGLQLVDELRKLGAKNCIISSNLVIRVDNKSFLKNQTLQDNGVVVYFDLKGSSKAMACDKWNKASYNLRALTHALHLELTFKDKLKLIYKLLTQKVVHIPIDYTSDFVYDVLKAKKRKRNEF
ncbi:MAG: hypothetical protein WC307_05015 [Candidatus Nanoarchaeia archaeon]